MLLNNHKTNAKSGRFRTGLLFASVFSLFLSGTVFAYEFDKPIEQVFRLGQDGGNQPGPYDYGKYGAIKMDLRYRFEYADAKETAPKPGIGNTLRLRLGYLTPKFFGFQGFGEFEGNWAMQEDYNSLRNGNTGFQVIADPEKAELNRLWLNFTAIPDTGIKGGRQRIKLDDDRFIGNVGWRQMEQTYDSVLVTNKSIPNLTIRAGYIGRVKTIISTTDDMKTPIFNINYKIGGIGHLVGYGYWIDYSKDPTKFKNSNFSYGVRFVGSPKLDDTFTGHYLLEYSKQQDMGQNPISYNVDRWHLLGGLTAWGFTLKAGMEQLDGENGKGFTTPLGTNHKFQGWADKFLNTPADGIRDVYASLGTSVFGIKGMFVYHNFKDDTGQIDYGNEYDFLLVRKFGKHYHLLAKYAYYVADGFATDTQKVWVQAGMSF